MTAVYKAIAAVQGELAKVGIAKANRNSQQGYNFRGIDDVYAALSPLLAKHGLCVIPRVIERNMLEKTTQKGNPLFYVTVHAEFDFVSSEDGSKHTASTFGEAMDSGDKATNKAMSAAYKYAAFMTFAIPTEGDNDADATTHEVAASGMPDAEYNRLTGMMKSAGVSEATLRKEYGVSDLRALNQQQYGDALSRLNKAIEKRAKAESNAAATDSFGEVKDVEFA